MDIVSIIIYVFQGIRYFLLAWIILSWVPIKPGSFAWPVKRFFNNFMRPIMAPFRKILPPMGGIDFSPIILFFALDYIRDFLIRIVAG